MLRATQCLDSKLFKIQSILTKPRYKGSSYKCLRRTRINITPNHIKTKTKKSYKYLCMAERGLFLFSHGRPQHNCSVVPGPWTNFLFPRGVSHGWQLLDQLFSQRSRPHTTEIGCGGGIPDTNQKDQPRT
jgi:hypothetical protein